MKLLFEKLNLISKRPKTVFTILCICSIVVGYIFFNYNFDDPFYTYRYVQNIVTGKGWLYTPGENYNASTSALNTILLALPSLIFQDIPAVAHVMGTIWLIGAAFVVYLIFRMKDHCFGGLCAGILLIFNPIILLTYGKESTLFLFLIGLSILFYSKKRLNLTAVFLALLFLTRPDGILLSVILFLDYFLKDKKLPFKPALCFLSVISPWLLYSFIQFGSFFPASLESKIYDGLYLHGVFGFFNGIFLYHFEYLHTAICLLPVLLLALPGVLLAFKKEDNTAKVIVFFGVLYTYSYILLHPPPYETYYVPIVYVATFAAGISIQFIYSSKKPDLRLIMWLVLPLLLCCHLISSLYFYNGIENKNLKILYQANKPKLWEFIFSEHEALSSAGKWLKKNTPEDSLIGMWEAGIIGYYSERPITDKLGVITLDVFHFSPSAWLEKYRPDYCVFAFEFPCPKTSPDLQYKPIKRFRSDRYTDLLIYKKIEGNETVEFPDISPIKTFEPEYDKKSCTPPKFSWSGKGNFTMDFFMPEAGDLIYRTQLHEPAFTTNEYIFDKNAWESIPENTEVFWRVNRMDPDNLNNVIEKSNMKLLIK